MIFFEDHFHEETILMGIRFYIKTKWKLKESHRHVDAG